MLEDQESVHHACEAETSLMMVVAPDTVRREKLPEAHGPAHSSTPPAGIARYRSFRDITPSGVIGDARRANAQKGEKLMAACRDGIAAVLRDPATWSSWPDRATSGALMPNATFAADAGQFPSPLLGGVRGGGIRGSRCFGLHPTPDPSPSRGGESPRRLKQSKRSAIERGAHG